MIIPMKYPVKHMLLSLSLLFTCVIASAQPGFITSLGLRDTLYDRTGQVYQLHDLVVNDTIRGYDTLIVNQSCNCDAGYFRLYFEPGSGLEDTTVSADTLRRNVLCRVFRDLSHFIQSPLTSTGEKVNIWVRNKDNVPGMSGVTSFGTSFYSIPAVPSVSGIVDNSTWLTIHSGVDGYTNVASINPWLISTSNATYFHAVIAFDFSSYTWHTNLATSPSSGNYDLYTIALREAAHILGITSAINDDGTSVLGTIHPYFTRFDKYLETHSGISLLSHSGSISMYNYQWNSALNTPSNYLSPYSLSCVTDSTICDTAIKYDGAVTIPLYTPNCYESGYSLSNFEDMCTGTPDPANNNLYFTVSNITFPGTLKRYLQTEERKVLCDIGYTVDTVFGDTSILNYRQYGSSVCDGPAIAGVNDGLDNTGAPVYFSSKDRKIWFNGSSLPSGIPGILDNDVNVDAFEGLEVVTGSGTLSTTSGTSGTDVFYTPSIGDLRHVLVRYVPFNTTSGQRGNLTYAELLVSSEPGCSVEPCNLVVNGDFSQASHCGPMDVVPPPGGPYYRNYVAGGAPAPPAHLCNWNACLGSTDLFRGVCETVYMFGIPTALADIPVHYTPIDFYDIDGVTAKNFIGFNSGRRASACSPVPGSSNWFSEASNTQLAAPLKPGVKYVLDFWARSALDLPWGYMSSSGSYGDLVMQFHVHPTDFAFPMGLCNPATNMIKWPSSWTGLPLSPLTDSLDGYYIKGDIPKAINTWHHIVDTFVYTGPEALSDTTPQFLYVTLDPRLTMLKRSGSLISNVELYGFISDIKIKPLIQTYPTITVCPGSSFNLFPDSIIMAPGYGGTLSFDTFLWVPSVTCTTLPCPFPTATITGTVVFTVTEAYYGCVSHQTVNTYTPTTVVVSADTPCSDDTLHLSSTGTTGVGTLLYSWSDPGGFTSTEAHPMRHPVSGGSYTYTLTVEDGNGCTTTTTLNATVNQLPGPIGGATSICVGQTISLTNSASGGTWTSSDGGVATIGSLSGNITGIAAGTAIITYGFGTDCMATVEVTVNPLPDPITGTLAVCVGSTTTLSSASPGGTWSSSNHVVGTIGSSGVVTGIVAGTTAITYTLSTGCYRVAIVTVNPLPFPIAGTLIICATGTTTLTSTSSGGTWQSGATAVATIGSSTGIALGEGAGTSVITYTLPTGCATTAILTVVAMPDVITGTAEVCEGATTTLSDAVTGGIWESSPIGTASVGSLTGVVTGVTAGTATITYTIGGLCSVYIDVTVHPMPSPISGSSTICVGVTSAYTATPTGGTWSSSAPSVGSIGSTTGVLSGESAGTATITYAIAGMCSVTKDITVNPSPGTISGTPTVCVMSATTLSCPGSGSWTSGATAVATVDISTGVVTGVGPGTATVTYTLSTGCFSTIVVTVYALPSAISGLPSICVGATGLYSASPATGAWSSGTPAVGTISTTGGLLGISAGTTRITYTLPTGCLRSRIITVNAVPASIAGTLEVCVGATTTLSDATPGGTWSSSDPFIGTVDASGVVTGVSPGTAVISYILSATSCYTTAVVTVHPLPEPITGTLSLCVGASTGLSDATPGGTWSSSDPAIGTIDASTGVWGSISVGTATITYSLSTGCHTTVAVTVLATPGPILGPLSYCEYDWGTLYDTLPGGGTWSASDVVVIEFFPGGDTALVHGSTAGTSVITYTLASGCFVTATVTVNPNPDITGTFAACQGNGTTLTATIAGGTWSSSNPTIASVTSGGVVAGLSVGTAYITYTAATGCLRVIEYTVNPLPDVISGTLVICEGVSTILGCSTPGGLWSSSTLSVATIGPASGIVAGISAGTSLITYTLPTGCYGTTVLTVNALPPVDPIFHTDSVICLDDTLVFDDATPGGSWSSSDPTVASIVIPPISWGVTGVVIYGLSPGTATISYSIWSDCGPVSATRTVTVMATPAMPEITGVLGVCSGYTDTLSASPPGGTWTSSGPGIATVDANGVVTGLTSGSVYISYTVTNICGTATATVNVKVNMEPYITTKTLVECQTLEGSDGGHPVIISSLSDCIKVCDSSTVRYYANGVAGSDFTWNIVGGIVVADYGDSIDVMWSTVGFIGSITLHDTFSHCIDSASACITVIDKPTALFSVTADTFCLGSTVYFTDLSSGDTASPILYWQWDYGDGSQSFSPGSTDHEYGVPNTYTVSLTVKNQCNCTNVYKKVITILNISGPDVVCPSLACDSDYSTYSTSATCGTYSWSVTGGTIIWGTGTASIVVHWDAVDPAGYGLVSLFTPGCGDCPMPTTIKVPIVMPNPEILGDSVVCEGYDRFEYKVPLWPATVYKWTVLGYPGYISPLECSEDYKKALFFPAAGTYTVHCRYQNKLTLCGGSVFKVVTVVPAATILGPTPICDGSVATYSLTGGYTADWTLTTASGTIVTTIPASATFTHTFATGTYWLRASGAYCSNPLKITVNPLPEAIDTILGPDIVCIDRPYTYHASVVSPSEIVTWDAIGGTVTPHTGPNVTVRWTSTGTKQLIAKRIDPTRPRCEGPSFTKTIILDVPEPAITGDTTPCANSTHDYHAGYDRGEVYDWQIIPNTAGSVVTGTHDPDINVLWNNTTSIVNALLIVTVRKCDTSVRDTLSVSVLSGPPISLTASDDTICSGETVAFTATSGGTSYLYDYGDGSPGSGIATASHSFPENHTSVSVTYHVTVSSSGVCAPVGTSAVDVTVLPGPDVYLVAIAGQNPCDSGDTLSLQAVTSTNVTISSISWSGAHAPTLPNLYRIWSPETVRVLVTATNGCTDSAKEGVACYDTCYIPATVDVDCETITLSAGGGSAIGHWMCVSGDYITFYTLNPGIATVKAAGVYKFRFIEDGTHCITPVVTAYVKAVADFAYRVKCGTGGMDSIFLINLSSTLPFISGVSYNWVDLTTATSFSTAFTPAPLVVPAGSTVSIALVLSAMDGTTPISCDTEKTFTLRPALTVDFDVVSTPTCTNIPVIFTPIITGPAKTFTWDFNDGSGLLLWDGKREFTYDPAAGFPNNRDVSLTVTDSIGCVVSFNSLVDVYPNALNGLVGDDTVACLEDVPIPLTYSPFPGSSIPTSYLWSTSETTISKDIIESGSYWITVTDGLGCKKTFPQPAFKATIIQTPTPIIRGKKHYCKPEGVYLNAYVGPGVLYRWYLDGSLVGGFANSPEYAGSIAAGSHTFQVEIEVTDTPTGSVCHRLSDIDTVIMYNKPVPPSIFGPDVIECGDGRYRVSLTAVEPVSGIYNWNDGRFGATNDSLQGGPFKVTFTDINGCTEFTDGYVPLPATTYFPYFPKGCYQICTEQMPLLLPTVPCTLFDNWAWLRNSSAVLSGTGPMGWYSISSNGAYQWALDNGVCPDTSEAMNVDSVACDKCQGVALAAFIACDSVNPTSYAIDVAFNSPAAGTHFLLGTDIGPVIPFSGTAGSGTFYTSTLAFSIMETSPIPDSVTVRLMLTDVGGGRCYQEVRVALDTCYWLTPERHLGDNSNPPKALQPVSQPSISTALAVFPNPASNEVSVSFDYGIANSDKKRLVIYDLLGRKMAEMLPDSARGVWKVQLADWACGVYVVRMDDREGVLHTARIVVTN